MKISEVWLREKHKSRNLWREEYLNKPVTAPSLSPTVAYVVYDNLWEMYFVGYEDRFSITLEKAKLFATEEDAAKALAEYSKGIKCEHYSIGIRKVQLADVKCAEVQCAVGA